MNTASFTTTLLVDQSPAHAFDAINNVREWWSEEIEGSTDKLNAEFKYHYEDVHRCQMKITEFIPGEKVVWLVMDNYFKFTKDNTEWTGTKIIFEISEKHNKTHIRFTHEGLVPAYECYPICRDAWSDYINNSLHKLITTGKGKPNGKGNPQTENEKIIAPKQVMVKMTLDRWHSLINIFDAILDSITDEQLQKEIAPDKNRGIYLLGHLIAVHDNMMPLLNFGEKLFPGLTEPFLNSPDKSVNEIPSAKELRTSWTKMNNVLNQNFEKLQPEEWFQKHTSVSAEDFIKEPHRNKLNILITRTSHLSWHCGQFELLK